MPIITEFLSCLEEISSCLKTSSFHVKSKLLAMLVSHIAAFLKPFQYTCCGSSWQRDHRYQAPAQQEKEDIWIVTGYLQAPEELPG